MKCISDDQIRILEKQVIDCCDVEEMMCDYADGEITESLEERLDQHTSECTNCCEFKESYLKTIQIASELKPPPLTIEAQNRLRQALNTRLGINLPMCQVA